MQIKIPQPCHENWHLMSPENRGRHCQKCDKVVHDFTGYSDAELKAFFEREQGGCGRFKTSQLGRDLHNQNSHNLKWAIAACSLLFLTCTELKAQNVVVATDDSVAVANVSTQTQMIRVVRATIHQADTLADQITRIRMRLGEFSIDTDIDSSNAVSISIPATEAGAVADFELYNLQGDTFVLLDVGLGQGSLYFSKSNGKWTALSLFNTIISQLHPIYPQVTMGIPAPFSLFEPRIVVPDLTRETIQTFYLGSPAIINKADTFPFDTMSYRGDHKKAVGLSKKSSNTGISKAWWAVIIGGIGLVVGWFWRKRRKP